MSFRLKPSRRAFARVARGAVRLNGMSLNMGDGAVISEKSTWELKAFDRAEILVCDSSLIIGQVPPVNKTSGDRRQGVDIE